MLQGTMDNDTNLNGVLRHAWSQNSITKVVAQVKNKLFFVLTTVFDNIFIAYQYARTFYASN